MNADINVIGKHSFILTLPEHNVNDIGIIRHAESQYFNIVVNPSRIHSYDIPSIDFTVSSDQ